MDVILSLSHPHNFQHQKTTHYTKSPFVLLSLVAFFGKPSSDSLKSPTLTTSPHFTTSYHVLSFYVLCRLFVSPSSLCLPHQYIRDDHTTSHHATSLHNFFSAEILSRSLLFVCFFHTDFMPTQVLLQHTHTSTTTHRTAT